MDKIEYKLDAILEENRALTEQRIAGRPRLMVCVIRKGCCGCDKEHQQKLD